MRGLVVVAALCLLNFASSLAIAADGKTLHSVGTTTPTSHPRPTNSLIQKALGRQSISFYPVNPAGNSFQSHMPGYDIELASTGITIQTQQMRQDTAKREASDGGLDRTASFSYTSQHYAHIDFIGASDGASLEGLNPTGAHINRLLGSDPAAWQRNLPVYSRVRYKNLYPGIDLVYYGQQKNIVEYDLVVAPHADLSQIRFKVSSDEPATLDQDGNICLDGTQSIRLARPVLYQDLNNGKKLIAGGFVNFGHGEFGFSPATYDHDKPLIVDPQINLIYATYAGGIHNDEAFGMTLDLGGNAYIVGHSASQDFPVTGNAIQQARKNIGTYTYDAVIMKFDASGTLLFSTFLGGSANDQANAVVVNTDGSIYIGGSTQSSDFPVTTGSFQTKLGGGSDAFLARLSNDGSQLLYSTFAGGNGDEAIQKILLNADGSLWIAGDASSTGLPASSNAVQKTPSGTDNYFIAKAQFNSNGALQFPYLTFFGGSNQNQENGFLDMTLDGSGNVYIAGGTFSGDYPVTSNAYEKPFPLSGGCYNSPTPNSVGILAKFSPDLSQTLYSTVIGGHTEDQNGYPVCNQFVRTVHLDPQGNAWLIGTVGMSDFPTTTNAISKQLNGNGSAGVDNFVAELSADGSQLLYGSYLGGSQFDYGSRAVWDASNNIWIVSNTQSTNYPVTANALQTTIAGGYDTALTELSSDATKILYATYLGGSGDEDINGFPQIALDAQSNIHLAGNTGSANYPVTATATQALLANGDQGADGTDIYYTILGTGLIGTVGPVIGGNAGDTTLTIQGAGFQSGASCQLTLSGNTITATSSTVSNNGTSVTCTFSLNGASTGNYDVTVTNPGSAGSFTKQGAFTVQNAVGPNVWVNVTGRSAIRFNTATTFTISYGNTGDTDAVGVPIMVGVPQNVTLNLVSPVTSFPAAQYLDQSLIPATAPMNGETVLPLFIPRIPAGGSASFVVTLNAPSSTASFSISAYSWKPFGTSVSSVASALGTYQNGDFTIKANQLGAQTLTRSVREIIRPMASGGGVGLDPAAAAKCIQDLTLLALQVAGQVFPPAQELQCGAQLAGYLGSALTTVINSSQPGYGAGDAGSDLSSLYANGGQVALSCFKALAGATPAGMAANTILALLQAGLQGANAIKDCQDAAKPQNPQGKPVSPIGAIDPNDKTGPLGDGSANRYIQGAKALTYNVAFENQPTATAPASQVIVTDQLDPTILDLSTLTLGTIQFGTNSITLPAGVNIYNTTYKLSPTLNVRIAGSLDQNTGLLKWTFTSIDPSTGQPPTDPTVGFLPPDTDGIKGQGSVLFNVAPKQGQTTGTQITNIASVVFDSNAAINTPKWSNTLDVDAPASSIAPLPANENTTAQTTTFTVNWSGSDKGSGVATYDIYVSDNGGSFSQWQRAVTATSATFTGTTGHTYGFYSIATDNAGNVEATKTKADTTTLVTNLITTATTLKASGASATAGTSLTFTATVAPASGTGTPTGTVTFLDGATTTIGTTTLSSGTATFTTTSLAVGAHTITASYSGDATYAASVSSSTTITISAVPTDFSLALSPSSGTITAGNTGTTTISIAPAGGFSQQIALSCSGLPSNTTCSFSPASVVPGGSSAATSTLTIKTNTTSSLLNQEPLIPRSNNVALAFAAGGIIFGFAFYRRRLPHLGLLAILFVVVGLSGCGGSSSSSSTSALTTPKGTYQVTVTGTSGSTTHTATYSLTIQ